MNLARLREKLKNMVFAKLYMETKAYRRSHTLYMRGVFELHAGL